MVQDIYPKIFHNQYTYHGVKEDNVETGAHIPVDDDYVMIFQGRTICLREDEEGIHIPRYHEIKTMLRGGQRDLVQTGEATEAHLSTDLIYLFAIDNRQYFLYRSAAKSAIDGRRDPAKSEALLELPGYEYKKIFEIRRKTPKHRVFAAETAYHLYVWYRDNAFCGRCGQPTEPDKKERMLFCPQCRNMIFPKIAPAVIVAVTRGDEILLTTYANREYKRYALIAGFTEIGETAEETVHREVMEEVGLPVKNIRYYKSQPWGFDSNLLLGFYCEVEETAEGSDHIRMDEKELATAEWVHRGDVPEYPEEISLTHEMMMRFKYGKI